MKYIKPAIVIFIFTISLMIIGKIFWEQELKYTQPTPVPDGYTAIPVNQLLDQNISLLQKSRRPKHLHFYNPDCPCSRFNMSHFSSLVRKYSKKIDFYIVLPTAEHLEAIAAEFGNAVPVIADPDDKLAKACGVYSTPQAVVIDTSGKLYFYILIKYES
ncbi:MAG: redoxin domain-containing protein [Fulvivirga sp.]